MPRSRGGSHQPICARSSRPWRSAFAPPQAGARGAPAADHVERAPVQHVTAETHGNGARHPEHAPQQRQRYIAHHREQAGTSKPMASQPSQMPLETQIAGQPPRCAPWHARCMAPP